MKESDGGAGFVAGFLLGGIAGAALALFLAPRAGEENRDMLLERGIELRVKAEEAAAKARVEADELLARGKVLLEEQKTRVQEAMEEGKEVANLTKVELLARYKAAKESGEAPMREDMGMPESRPETM